MDKLAFAKVLGKDVIEMPKDLFIPPDALEIFLDSFQGPLDFLLYLIRKQNLDILDIPVALITEQYIKYIELMKSMRLELAAEYLVMAALLTEIKSRMLLPKPKTDDEDEDDPRAELVRRLQEYERYKEASENLDSLPRLDRDIFQISLNSFVPSIKSPDPKATLQDLLDAMVEVLTRERNFIHHHIEIGNIDIRDKMAYILEALTENNIQLNFYDLLRKSEGRLGVVVSFSAVLELGKEGLLTVIQNNPFEPIYLARA